MYVHVIRVHVKAEEPVYDRNIILRMAVYPFNMIDIYQFKRVLT